MSAPLRIRPSSLKRLALCPGSERLSVAARARAPQEESQEASLGTLCHNLVAYALALATRGDRIATREQAEELLRTASEFHYLSGYDQWACLWCIGTAYRLIQKHDIQPGNILVEHQLDGADLGLGKGGTADLVLVVPFKLVVIIDWKLGALEQDHAETNDQLAGYAVMAGRTFRCNEVHVHLAAPKVEPDNRLTSAAFNAATLKDAEQWVRVVAANAQEPAAPVVAGYDQCHYCDALPVCPVAREFIMRAIDALELLGPPTTADGWGDLIGAGKLAARFAEQAVDMGRDYLTQGGRPTGWKLRPGGNTKTLTDPGAAWEIAKAAGLVDAMARASTPSLTKLREALGPEVVESVFGRVITEVPRSPSLVPDKGGKK